MEALKTVLAGLKVIDLGTGMGPALAARFLADAGAQVTRFERPAGTNPFAGLYPAEVAWREGVEVVTIDSPTGAAAIQAVAGAMAAGNITGFARRDGERDTA